VALRRRTMKRILVTLLFMLCLPCLCAAQDIFVDYIGISDIDQTIYWVMTDANAVKYRGGCTTEIGVDPNAYCEAHKAEWLAAIYAANTDPNIPDWTDSHMGKYQAGLNFIDTIDTWAEQRAWDRKIFKTLYPGAGIED